MFFTFNNRSATCSVWIHWSKTINHGINQLKSLLQHQSIIALKSPIIASTAINHNHCIKNNHQLIKTTPMKSISTYHCPNLVMINYNQSINSQWIKQWTERELMTGSGCIPSFEQVLRTFANIKNTNTLPCCNIIKCLFATKKLHPNPRKERVQLYAS